MFDYTEQQKDAIFADGGTLLVSAAAGAGKTTVLVERVARLLTEGKCSADSLVIVTFTKPAAAELRERLDGNLQKRIAANPNDSTLHMQKLLLSQAHIGTIHSFCGKLLRQYFREAEIRPDFRVADQSETALMRAELLDRLISERFDSDTSGSFREMADMLSGGRGDSRIAACVLKLDDFIDSFPEPEAALASMAEHYRSGLPLRETVWGGLLFGELTRLAGALAEICEDDMDTASINPETEKYLKILEGDMELYRHLAELTAEKDEERLLTFMSTATFARSSGLPKNAEYRDYLSFRRNKCKALFGKAKALISLARSFSDDRQKLKRAVDELCSLVSELRAGFSQAKEEKGVLDYGDLEHKTFDLLCRKENGQYYQTDTAAEVSERLSYIFIDEYQDTNKTQDLILRAAAKQPKGQPVGDGENVFLVGDIKQSIYSFRQAEPGLFIDRYSRYPRYLRGEPVFPSSVTLDRNYRSRPEINGFVNYVFERLMTAESSGIDYGAGHRLVCSSKAAPDEEHLCEIHIIDRRETVGPSDAEDARDESSEILEARYIARTIKSMLGSFEVTDKSTGQKRPARQGDFCVLRRSIAGRFGEAFINEFRSEGLSVSFTSESGFYSSPEVSLVLSLLRVIDNPLSDIHLAAVLRSPIFGYDCDNLYELRSGSRKSLYSLLLSRESEGDEKAARAAGTIRLLRDKAAVLPLSRLISSIYRLTGLTAIVSAMHEGENRAANLRLLVSTAESFERSGEGGISAFLRMTEMRSGNKDKCADPSTDGGERVRIMTIHGAKGLEFPVVILAGTESRGNSEDEKAFFVLDSECRLGLRLNDSAAGASFPTLLQKTVSRSVERGTVAEELRVLYVAMTRASEKLIVTACVKRKELLKNAMELLGNGRLSGYLLSRRSDYLDLILACVLQETDARSFLELPERIRLNRCVHRPEGQPEDTEIKIMHIPASSLSAAAAEEEEAAAVPPEPDEELCGLFRSRLSYRYPYLAANTMTSKVTASQTHNFADGGTLSVPSFLSGEKLTPTQLGTAVHRFMEHADFAAASAGSAPELDRLLKEGRLTEAEYGMISPDMIDRFFAGRIGEYLKNAKEILREWRFTAELPESMYGLFFDTPVSGETVVLQGACDLIIITGEGAVLVDYKTDRVRQVSELAERYGDQLRLYSCAIEQILSLPVIAKIIYSFRLGGTVDVD